MTSINRRTFVAGAALAASVAPALADYPEKIIKIIAPAPPGGSPDIMSRMLQPGMQELLKQNVIVENRGGAGGYIGSEAVAKSPPDGYTLLLGGAFTANTALLKTKSAYDPGADLVPIAIFASVPNVLVVGKRQKSNTVAELVADAKARPGKLNMGSNGVGTTLHLSGELFMLRTGATMTHVPFRGWSDCVVGVINGDIDMMFDNLNTAIPNIKDGKLRPLAVTAATRHPSLPDVPTLAELGIKDAEVTSWFAIMVPAKTPAAIMDRLGVTLETIAAKADFKRLISQQGMDPTFFPRAEATKFWLAEIEKWDVIIKKSGLEKQD